MRLKIKKSYIIILLVLITSTIFAKEKNNLNTTDNTELIYNVDTITWFGADFSLFRLSNKKKVGQEQKLLKYFYAWSEYYKLSISNVKMANWLSIKKVFNDKEFTDEAYKKLLPSKWIIETPHTISSVDIESHLLNYTSKHTGIGLTFMVESFYKGDPSMVHGYFVWFDIKSKKILHLFKTNGGPSSLHAGYRGVTVGKDKNLPKQNGMTGYWLNGMVESTLKFKIDFKEKNPTKKEN